jgi:hypothetical protein
VSNKRRKMKEFIQDALEWEKGKDTAIAEKETE